MNDAYRKNIRVKNLQKLLDLYNSGDPENELGEEHIKQIEDELDRLSD